MNVPSLIILDLIEYLNEQIEQGNEQAKDTLDKLEQLMDKYNA